MKVLPTNGILFQSHLKELYKKGKIKVEYGLYGEKLTKKNVTDEHIKCRCYGGTNDEANIALATNEANNRRGNKPISEFLTYEMLRNYLRQFKGVKAEGFDGNAYIEKIRKTLRSVFNDEAN